MTKEAAMAGSCIAASWMLGQVDPDAVGTLVSNLGAVGAVIWLVYHTQTKVLPSIVSEFRQELAQVRAANQTELNAWRSWQHEELALLRQALEKDRESDERAMTSLAQAIQDLAAKVGN
ncbi:MAG: hypothetical protein U0836_16230 [Pirellulales bacterium]